MRLGGTWLLGASVTTIQVHDDGRVPESQGRRQGGGASGGRGSQQCCFLLEEGEKEQLTGGSSAGCECPPHAPSQPHGWTGIQQVRLSETSPLYTRRAFA